MSQGFLLFAHNNEEINYGLLAAWTAKRIAHYLNKPVSLVADNRTLAQLKKSGQLKYFDQVIGFGNSYHQYKRYQDRSLTFHNYDRSHAWDLTPYNETMVIDTDIVIQSNAMNCVWNNRDDLVVCKRSVNAFDVTTTQLEFKRLSDTGIPFYWATEFYFRKTDESKVFFETCKWVRSHYGWLSGVYGVSSKLMRNDYVWSIALHLLGGKQHADWCPSLPWTLMHTTDRVNLHSIDSTVVVYDAEFGVRQVAGQDIHVMNKFDLVRLAAEEMRAIA